MLAVIVSLACATSALAQAGMIKGKVLDPKGQPVEGAKVEIVSAESDARKYSTTTDKKGEFVQIGLRSGAYKVMATKEGVGSQGLNATVRQGGAGANLTFNLSPVSNLSAADQKAMAALQAAFTAGADAVKAGNHDLAIAKFQEAIAASPNCKDCYVNIGYSQTEKKNYTEAEAAFKKAIELDANAGEAYSGLAAVYNAQKKYDLAAEAGAKAAALGGGAAGGGGGAEASYNQGVILFNAQKFAEAKVQFETAVKANPGMAIAQYQLGMTALNLGQIPDAVKALETYLQLEPNGEKSAEVKAALPALKSMVK
jgi:tetratricopeptide (TPR) repeat protein